jgi:hypothetical protein
MHSLLIMVVNKAIVTALLVHSQRCYGKQQFNHQAAACTPSINLLVRWIDWSAADMHSGRLQTVTAAVLCSSALRAGAQGLLHPPLAAAGRAWPAKAAAVL